MKCGNPSRKIKISMNIKISSQKNLHKSVWKNFKFQGKSKFRRLKFRDENKKFQRRLKFRVENTS